MNAPREVAPADRACLLGRAWLERGRDDAAYAHLREAIALDPAHREAHRQLAYWHVRRNEFATALAHLGVALEEVPRDSPLREEWALLRQLAGLGEAPADLPDQAQGKLKFRARYDRTHHRSGWRDALSALEPLHNSSGVLFEGFLEDPFAWQHPRDGMRSGPELLRALRTRGYASRLTSEELRVLPFREPWVGFMHNPPGMPRWFHYGSSPQAILAKPVWQESMRHCRGLFVLSEHFARWLRGATGKPVSSLVHPTARPSVMFDYDRFVANPDKRIVQVGWWLRRLSAIYRMPISPGNALGYRKLRLIPDFAPAAEAHLRELLARECAELDLILDPDQGDVDCRQHVSNDEYDRLLAENIVFIELYDASASNTVIECIARATPLLVNPLPAVVEYLGAGYPLYVADAADAAVAAMDLGRLRAAHEYLLACEIRARLDPDSFRRSFEASEVYQRL